MSHQNLHIAVSGGHKHNGHGMSDAQKVKHRTASAKEIKIAEAQDS